MMDGSGSKASTKASLVVLVLLLAACSPMADNCQSQTGCQAKMANPGSTVGAGSNTSASSFNDNGYSNGSYGTGSVASSNESASAGFGGAGFGGGGSGTTSA
jgi:uncharacterized membrane protein